MHNYHKKKKCPHNVCSLGADKSVHFLMHQTHWRLTSSPLPFINHSSPICSRGCWEFPVLLRGMFSTGKCLLFAGEEDYQLVTLHKINENFAKWGWSSKWVPALYLLISSATGHGWLSKSPKLLGRLTWGLYRTRLAATHLNFLIPLWTLEEDTTLNQWKI